MVEEINKRHDIHEQDFETTIVPIMKDAKRSSPNSSSNEQIPSMDRKWYLYRHNDHVFNKKFKNDHVWIELRHTKKRPQGKTLKPKNFVPSELIIEKPNYLQFFVSVKPVMHILNEFKRKDLLIVNDNIQEKAISCRLKGRALPIFCGCSNKILPLSRDESGFQSYNPPRGHEFRVTDGKLFKYIYSFYFGNYFLFDAISANFLISHPPFKLKKRVTKRKLYFEDPVTKKTVVRTIRIRDDADDLLVPPKKKRKIDEKKKQKSVENDSIFCKNDDNEVIPDEDGFVDPFGKDM